MGALVDYERDGVIAGYEDESRSIEEKIDRSDSMLDSDCCWMAGLHHNFNL